MAFCESPIFYTQITTCDAAATAGNNDAIALILDWNAVKYIEPVYKNG